MVFRSFCVVLSALLASMSNNAFAQCSPTSGPLPATLLYVSHEFHIPVFRPFSDGSAKRTKKDCDALQSRLEGEGGKGLVTRAVEEFKQQLELSCARLERVWSDWEEAPNGDLCLIMSEIKSRLPSFNSWGEFCKSHISVVYVEEQKYVTAIFDDVDLPCEESFSKTTLYCVGEQGPYSPDFVEASPY